MSRPPPPPGAPPGPPSFRPVPPPARIIPVAVIAPVSVPVPPSVPPPPVAPTPPEPIVKTTYNKPVEPEIDAQSYHEELFDDLDHGGYDEADAQASYEELLAVDTEQMYLSDNEAESEPQQQPATVPQFSPPPVPNTPPPPVPPPHIVHAAVPDDYLEEIPEPVVLPPGRYDPPIFSQPLPDEVETALDDAADAVPAGSQVWIKDVAQVWVSVTIAGKKNREEDSKVINVACAAYFVKSFSLHSRICFLNIFCLADAFFAGLLLPPQPQCRERRNRLFCVSLPPSESHIDG